jgi:hypothetical protein
MFDVRVHRLALVVVAALIGSLGCDGSADSAADGASTGTGAAAIAEPGYFTGRVALADGSPITLPGVKYSITINGVTAVGERNGFTPKVNADGTFRLKLPQGMFYPPYGTITVPFESKNYIVPLHPIDPVEETRDSAEGIVQNFAWQLTGAHPRELNPDPQNATHWYGITIPLIRQVYREDAKESQQPLPDGTKVTWTLKPISKRMDGAEAQPLTLERTSGANASVFDKLNDLPPANYEVSAVAKLPDGSTKRVLLVAAGDSSNVYRPTAHVVLEPYGNTSEVVVNQIYWALE